MTDFGDFDTDDALDTEPPDAEQVAIRLRKYQRDVDSSLPSWDDMDAADKAKAIGVMVLIIAWLRRQGAVK